MTFHILEDGSLFFLLFATNLNTSKTKRRSLTSKQLWIHLAFKFMNQIPQYTCHENAILWIFVISKKIIFLRWPLSKTRAGHHEIPLNLRFIHWSKTASLTSSILGISVASSRNSAGRVFISWHEITSQTTITSQTVHQLDTRGTRRFMLWKGSF